MQLRTRRANVTSVSRWAWHAYIARGHILVRVEAGTGLSPGHRAGDGKVWERGSGRREGGGSERQGRTKGKTRDAANSERTPCRERWTCRGCHKWRGRTRSAQVPWSSSTCSVAAVTVPCPVPRLLQLPVLSVLETFIVAPVCRGMYAMPVLRHVRTKREADRARKR